MFSPSCATESLAPYIPDEDNLWDDQKIRYLYRRLGFSAPIKTIKSARHLSPSNLVDQLIDNAVNASPSGEPEWLEWDYPKFEARYPNQELREQKINEAIFDWMNTWMRDMIEEPVRGKMILFWHNHFVTQLDTFYFPRYLYDYHTLLQSKALGNFKEFVYEMGKNTAMLLFLNGAESTKYEPNENYARELFELFTLGQDVGYTQQDIVEASRALTGWNRWVSWGTPLQFAPNLWDSEEKTIFGQTGHWGYDELHEILFTERADEIAYFICKKIYTAFVHPTPNEVVIKELATLFKEVEWEIAPVLKRLFKSQHFFDTYNIGVQVKSPLDLFFNFYTELQMDLTRERLEGLHYFAGMLGQQLGSPIDVAGWQGNRTWLDTARLSGRWRLMGWLAWDVLDNYGDNLTELAIELTGSQSTNDPWLVTRKVVDFFLPNELHTPELYERATEEFKVEIPQNYFDEGTWNLHWDTIPWQMTSLMHYLIKIPEFQLT